jgi:hypothetical protein
VRREQQVLPAGVDRVVRILIVVDLPAPLGPSRPNTVPAGTEKLSPSRAVTFPYLLDESDGLDGRLLG